MRVDPLILLAHDYLQAGRDLAAELRRLAADERLEDLPENARKLIAHEARRGAHAGVTIASIAQPKQQPHA